MENNSGNWNSGLVGNSPEERDSFISIRTQMLALVFNRKCPSEMVEVYQRALRTFTIQTLERAFRRAENELERFPTPKTMTALCAESSPSQAWRYNYMPGTSVDDETGMPVNILIDPTAGNGVDPEMFRPQDCKAGRAFLAKLKEIARKEVSK